MLTDQTIVCIGCGALFVWSVAEQRFYASKLDKITGKPYSPPKRCHACRDKKKAERFDQMSKEKYRL